MAMKVNRRVFTGTGKIVALNRKSKSWYYSRQCFPLLCRICWPTFAFMLSFVELTLYLAWTRCLRCFLLFRCCCIFYVCIYIRKTDYSSCFQRKNVGMIPLHICDLTVFCWFEQLSLTYGKSLQVVRVIKCNLTNKLIKISTLQK